MSLDRLLTHVDLNLGRVQVSDSAEQAREGVLGAWQKAFGAQEVRLVNYSTLSVPDTVRADFESRNPVLYNGNGSGNGKSTLVVPLLEPVKQELVAGEVVPLDFVEREDRLYRSYSAIAVEGIDPELGIALTPEVSPRLESLGLRMQQLLDAANVIEGDQELIRIDSLIKIPNQRAFAEMYARSCQQWERGHIETLSLLKLDLNFFKEMNDVHGHPFGDYILRSVAAYLATQIRGEDFVARVGGDEYSILLLGNNLETSYEKAQRIATSIEQVRFEKGDPLYKTVRRNGKALGRSGKASPYEAGFVSLSIGVASTSIYDQNEGEKKIDRRKINIGGELETNAEHALQAAKEIKEARSGVLAKAVNQVYDLEGSAIRDFYGSNPTYLRARAKHDAMPPAVYAAGLNGNK